MSEFKLDKRLENDCLILGQFKFSLLLLMNNSLVPWFILVPKTTEVEITDLKQREQEILLNEINLISKFIKDNFDISRLNIAAIGNIVNQLHVHVIGRDPSDFCWPDVVWGTNKKESYKKERVLNIKIALYEQLGSHLTSPD